MTTEQTPTEPVAQILHSILETQEVSAGISQQLAQLIGRIASGQEIALLTTVTFAEILVEVLKDLDRPDLLDKLSGTLQIASAALKASKDG